MTTRHARIGGPTDALNHPRFDQVYTDGRSGSEICKEKHYFHMLQRGQSIWLKNLFRRAEELTKPDPRHRDKAKNVPSVPIKRKGGKR